VPPEGVGPFRVLELGAGTGTLSRFVLETFPTAELTVLDVSPVMLEACATALASFAGRTHLRRGDFGSAELGSGYHAAVSRLAIHHLEDEDKRALFGRLAKALLPGGILAMSDLITGATEAESRAMLAEWRSHMLAQGEDPAEWARWLVGEDDLPSPAHTQVEWLLEAGFAGASVVWQRANFAILLATKAA
jgi:tRNA (cmo5U34)-methyltransferase